MNDSKFYWISFPTKKFPRTTYRFKKFNLPKYNITGSFNSESTVKFLSNTGTGTDFEISLAIIRKIIKVPRKRLEHLFVCRTKWHHHLCAGLQNEHVFKQLMLFSKVSSLTTMAFSQIKCNEIELVLLK